MTTKNFEIGQVVYILAEQAQTILPGLVVEECVVKKITGNSTSWKVKVGLGDRAKLFDSAKIKGELYGSLEEVKTVMTERLLAFVNNLGSEAEQRVEKWYGKEIAEKEKNAALVPSGLRSTGVDDRIDPEALLNSLEGPSASTPKFVAEKPVTNPSGEGLKERLKRMALPEDEGTPDLSADGATFYVDVNGSRIPVRQS